MTNVNQLNLEEDSDEIPEILESPNQVLTISKHIEMQEQGIEIPDFNKTPYYGCKLDRKRFTNIGKRIIQWNIYFYYKTLHENIINMTNTWIYVEN